MRRASIIVFEPQFDLAENTMCFSVLGVTYSFSLPQQTLSKLGRHSNINWLVSPDGTHAAFLRDHNLWVVDIDSGCERALTTDGTEFNSYADTPAAMRGYRARQNDALPEALWSPNGKWLLTLQTDDRHVPELSIVDYVPVQGVRPIPSANRTSLPGDPKVTEFRIVAIEVDTQRQVEARHPRLCAVRMNSTPLGSNLAWWGKDSKTAYFVDIERGERTAHLVELKADTGATRIVFSEVSDTYIEMSVNVYTKALLYPLPATDELVWYSERSGHGHLYLYDLATGTCRNQITSGDWQVRDILHVDAIARDVLFMAAGIADGENPYICKPCLASLDSGAVRVVSPEKGDHLVWTDSDMSLKLKKLEGRDPRFISGTSPSGVFFIETISCVDGMPTTFLRRRDGDLIVVLETATWTPPDGWQWPESVTLNTAGGEERMYGLLFKPLGYVPGQRYPLIDLIYGGPQINNVPQSSFADGSRGTHTFLDAAHLAAIGVFVLIVDGRGTAYRERSFRVSSYRAVQSASNLDDHISAIRQLEKQRSDIDLEKVGVTGFSAGGYMCALAALRHGDFFKVAVAGSGNYDQSLFWHSWGERYHGEYSKEHYSIQAAKTYASELVGKLLLVHGLRDEGCHPAALFQLIQSLIDANKDPDIVILPGASHEWTGYGMRRRLDYFTRHLLDAIPPGFPPFELPIERVVKKMGANMDAASHA